MSKAKIRKTSEIVDIICFNCSTDRSKYDSISYIDSKGIEHVDEHLNYYWDFEAIRNHGDSIDWEQRRYEIAKEFYIKLIFQGENTLYSEAVKAIGYADSLIENLKKK